MKPVEVWDVCPSIERTAVGHRQKNVVVTRVCECGPEASQRRPVDAIGCRVPVDVERAYCQSLRARKGPLWSLESRLCRRVSPQGRVGSAAEMNTEEA